MKHFLGKKPVRHDARTLRLSNYLTAQPVVPQIIPQWSANITNWGMMGNGKVGDCTCAAAGHMIRNWYNMAGRTVIVPDAGILNAYESVSGYSPSDSSTDVGADCLSVLNYWRKTGVGGDRIAGYAAFNSSDIAHLKAAVYLFGGAYIGVQMPLSADGASEWSIANVYPDGDATAGSWGGHCVPIIGYGSKTLSVLSWGKVYQMTWGFYLAYADETYAVLSSDWLNPKKMSPAGLNLAALQADLKTL